MSVRQRVWTTTKGKTKKAWIAEYATNGVRHIETFDKKRDARQFQRDLFTNRYRGVAAPSPSEYQIQIALIARLKLLARKDCVYFHIPNGGKRGPREAALFKALGVLPGAPDLIFLWYADQYSTPQMSYSRVLFLEVKAKGRKPTPAQLHFKERVQACGAHWEWVDSLDEAVKILTAYGIMGRGPARIGRLSEG